MARKNEPKGDPRPSKGEPVYVGGDAGGPNDARGIIGPDIDQDIEQPPPSYLGDKPGKKKNEVPTVVRLHGDALRLKGKLPD